MEKAKSGEELRLEKTVEDVRQVLALAQEGRTVKEIARSLGLEEQYVYDIQVTAQWFREEDEIAVAHLMCMESACDRTEAVCREKNSCLLSETLLWAHGPGVRHQIHRDCHGPASPVDPGSYD